MEVSDSVGGPSGDQIDQTVSIEIARGKIASAVPGRECANACKRSVTLVYEEEHLAVIRRPDRNIDFAVAGEVRANNAAQFAAVCMKVERSSERPVAIAKINCDTAVFIGDCEVGVPVTIQIRDRDVLGAVGNLAGAVGRVQGGVADVEPRAKGAQVIEEVGGRKRLGHVEEKTEPQRHQQKRCGKTRPDVV